jgi:geranylgeranyl diphosphate synthase type II
MTQPPDSSPPSDREGEAKVGGGHSPSHDVPAAVEAYLADYLDQAELPANLRQAIRYALLAGGKRLRPTLAIRCAEAAGGSAETALPAAAALELVHNFSLAHDDLPAMDDDDLRRGRPTLHKHAGEAMAILAGDAMLALAFQLLSDRSADAGLAGRLTGELSHATTAMISGQVYDTLPPEDAAQKEPMSRLRQIHLHKTAALLRYACRMGAISSDADATTLNALNDYGNAIGLMFQAVDDLLDVTQSPEQMGKATRKDANQGKLTYPGLLGVESTRAEVDRLREAAHAALSGFDERAQPLRALCDYMASRQR